MTFSSKMIRSRTHPAILVLPSHMLRTQLNVVQGLWQGSSSMCMRCCSSLKQCLSLASAGERSKCCSSHSLSRCAAYGLLSWLMNSSWGKLVGASCLFASPDIAGLAKQQVASCKTPLTHRSEDESWLRRAANILQFQSGDGTQRSIKKALPSGRCQVQQPSTAWQNLFML